MQDDHLLVPGGDDDVPSVMDADKWPANLGSERDWNFQAQPNSHLNGRSIPLSMGKVLGGGSSINLMAWARGHQSDWDFFASEAGDPAWSYASVLQLYRRIEDWHGEPDPEYRGTGGPVFVQPAPDPNPIARRWGFRLFPADTEEALLRNAICAAIRRLSSRSQSPESFEPPELRPVLGLPEDLRRCF